jgi:serine/threonine protein kinase
MAGFLKRLLGGRQRPVGGEPAPSRRTVHASHARESEAHVQTICSGQLDSAAEQNGRREEEDTGPYPIGKTVGRIYQIRRVLGRGGMGIVYLAYDTATQRNVAVKVPLGKFVEDKDAQDHFVREGEAWMELVHPHIVRAFDIRDDETTDYRPAMFMDYCQGGSLAERLAGQTPLPFPDALDIAIQICSAMEFAHRKGRIHRDLKAGNILLTGDGRAQVSDFGLVRSLDMEDLETSEDVLRRDDPQLHASVSGRAVVGTPEYMPPEQWEGKSCPQSDVYAFGILLYELFCGCRPFTAKHRAELRTVHLTASPPVPRRLNGEVPDDLSRLMLRCLAKEPASRPRSFQEVGGELVRVFQALTGTPYQSRRGGSAARELSREQRAGQGWMLVRQAGGCRLRGTPKKAERLYHKATRVFERLDDLEGPRWARQHVAQSGKYPVFLGGTRPRDGALRRSRTHLRPTGEEGRTPNGLGQPGIDPQGPR